MWNHSCPLPRVGGAAKDLWNRPNLIAESSSHGRRAEGLFMYWDDADYCFRVREAGYRNIWTPSAELYHHQSATRGFEDTPEKIARAAAEARYMQNRWGRLLLNDPAYSPNLTLEREDFAYAWPPLRVSAGVAAVDQEVWTPKAEPVRK